VERSATSRSPAARCTRCALIGAACGSALPATERAGCCGSTPSTASALLQRRRGRVSPDADHCRRARQSLVRRLTDAARRSSRAAPPTGAHHVSTAQQRFHQRPRGGAGRVGCGSRATTGQASVISCRTAEAGSSVGTPPAAQPAGWSRGRSLGDRAFARTRLDAPIESAASRQDEQRLRRRARCRNGRAAAVWRRVGALAWEPIGSELGAR
jgi:hypothetical protein